MIRYGRTSPTQNFDQRPRLWPQRNKEGFHLTTSNLPIYLFIKNLQTASYRVDLEQIIEELPEPKLTAEDSKSILTIDADIQNLKTINSSLIGVWALT